MLAADTLTTIASGLAAAINADAHLSAIGVTATSSSTVVNIKSTSINATTYAESTSGGATETITLGPGTGISQFAYNNVNALTGISAGGAARYQGNTNKAIKSATINGTTAATLTTSESFAGNQILSSGANNTTVTSVDGGNNSVTDHYQVSVSGPSSSSLTTDAVGNMTSDGTNSYAWDAENRLIKITYPGTNNFSQFSYDGLDHLVEIVETRAGSVTSTKQFVWCDDGMCEARNATGGVIAQYFAFGQTISGTSYYFSDDHLGSVREVADSAGNIQATYTYDSFGQPSELQGSLSSDIQYAGYYYHAPSKLSLALHRAYSAALGRWINRDPIEERDNPNLYEYVDNSPLNFVDPSGLEKQKHGANCPIPPIPPTVPDLYGPPAPRAPSGKWSPPKYPPGHKGPKVPPPPATKSPLPETPPGTYHGPRYVPPPPPPMEHDPYIGPINKPPGGLVPPPPSGFGDSRAA